MHAAKYYDIIIMVRTAHYTVTPNLHQDFRKQYPILKYLAVTTSGASEK